MALIEKPLPGHGNMKFKVTEAPEIEPITADEVKDYCSIDTDAQDTLIDSLITAVRQAAEPWLGRALIEQTITAYLDHWPDNPVRLPRPPLVSISSIVTLSEEDAATTYDSDNYYYNANVEPGQVVVKAGCSPPINTDRYYSGYRIIYLAGYGEEATDVPQIIRTGLLEWVQFALENKVVDRDPPQIARALLGAYRIHPV